MNAGFIVPIIVLAVVGIIVYYFVVKKKGATSSGPGPNWTFQYSSNMVAGQTPADFDYPTKDGVHYCVKSASGLKPGGTITFRFTQTGSGTVTPTQFPEHGAKVRVYVQRKGDDMSGSGPAEFYRLWCVVTANNDKEGSFSIVAPLVASSWTGVFGKNPSDAQLADTLTNAAAMGWTHGGDMAGHGQFTVGGPMHFHLDEYTV